VTLYRPRSQPVQAWQCTSSTRTPGWVVRSCLWLGGEIVLDRPSGRQVVLPGEWLVRTLDGEILWYPADEFEREYEEQT